MKRIHSALALVLFLAATLAAAGQDSRPAAPGREELIRIAEEVKKDVEEIRGWKFKHDVKTDVRTEAQLREFIEKKLFEEQYAGDKLKVTEAFLRMVGLIPADCDLRKTTMDVLLNQIGGFYDPDTKAFYMMDRGGYGPLLTRTLVAHELTHALDDQYTQLDKLVHAAGETEDAGFAIGAVVEGSATHLMMIYMQRAMASGKYDAAELGQAMQDEMKRSEVFMKAPRYFTTLAANYLCGMYFVSNGEPPVQPKAGGAAELAARTMQQRMLRLFKDLPASSEQILHPEKYWDDEKRDEPVVLDDKVIESLVRPAGSHVIHRSVIGELLCAILASDPADEFDMMLSASPDYWTNDAAKGWGGDRFFLIADGPDEKAATKDLKNRRGVWVTMWDTPDDREEFIDDFQFHRPEPARRLIRLGERVAIFTFVFSPESHAALESVLANVKLDFRKGGKPWNPAK